MTISPMLGRLGSWLIRRILAFISVMVMAEVSSM